MPPPLLKFLATPLCGRDDFFFAVHLGLSEKLDICGCAALGFKIFSNAALHVNIIAHPWSRLCTATCWSAGSI